MKKCTCKYENDDDRVFCLACGKSLENITPIPDVKKNINVSNSKKDISGELKIMFLNDLTKIYLICSIIGAIVVFFYTQQSMVGIVTSIAIILQGFLLFAFLRVFCDMATNILKIRKGK